MSKARGRRRVLATESGPELPTSAVERPARRELEGSALALVALALAGLGVSIYLTLVHYAHTVLICSNSGAIDCAKVLSSIYSVIPGTQIPVTVPGIVFFLVCLGLAVAQLRRAESRQLRRLELIWGALGMLTVLYLVFCELFELRTICLWCSSVHLLTLATLLLAIWRLEPAQGASERR